MKNNKPKRPLLTAGLVVSIFAIILSWTELGVPLSILAAALILTEIARSNNILEIRDHINKNYYPLDFTLDEIRDTYKFNELKR